MERVARALQRHRSACALGGVIDTGVVQWHVTWAARAGTPMKGRLLALGSLRSRPKPLHNQKIPQHNAMRAEAGAALVVPGTQDKGLLTLEKFIQS